MTEREYTMYTAWILKDYEPLFLELVLQAKWEILAAEGMQKWKTAKQ